MNTCLNNYKMGNTSYEDTNKLLKELITTCHDADKTEMIQCYL